jgi:hypothetical protein
MNKEYKILGPGMSTAKAPVTVKTKTDLLKWVADNYRGDVNRLTTLTATYKGDCKVVLNYYPSVGWKFL